VIRVSPKEDLMVQDFQKLLLIDIPVTGTNFIIRVACSEYVFVGVSGPDGGGYTGSGG
jgi:hypothetical protein